MALHDVLRREVRVALSRRAQPAWFRVTKWVVAITIASIFWRRPHFWWWVAGVLGASVALHLVWRWKTRGWTQPWMGWDDIETADRIRRTTGPSIDR